MIILIFVKTTLSKNGATITYNIKGNPPANSMQFFNFPVSFVSDNYTGSSIAYRLATLKDIAISTTNLQNEVSIF